MKLKNTILDNNVVMYIQLFEYPSRLRVIKLTSIYRQGENPRFFTTNTIKKWIKVITFFVLFSYMQNVVYIVSDAALFNLFIIAKPSSFSSTASTKMISTPISSIFLK